MGVHRLDRAEARAIAVRAHVLHAQRPTDLLMVVRLLTLLQIDPTAAIAPSAHLVAWSRLGSSYQPTQLQQALEEHRTLVEHNATVRPMSDLGMYLAGAVDWPGRETSREWLRRNDSFRPARHLRAVAVARHPGHLRGCRGFDGVEHNRNVTQMLEYLMMRGEVAIAGRRGRQRLWDLAERV